MKIKFILIIVSLLNVSCCKIASQENSNIKHSQSKVLIERYNILRGKNKLPIMVQDTILDNICKTLISNNKYINSNNTFNEDSIRHLLYRNGIIDYQYNIKVTLDNDTTTIFDSFLLSDNSNHLYVGYAQIKNKHILFKTKSYLKFDHGIVSAHSTQIDGFSKVVHVDIKTDSIIRYFNILEPDKYYYQFYNRLPLNNDDIDTINKMEATTIKIDDNTMGNIKYNLIIKSINSDNFLIISNKKNERVAIVK